ncbi:MAG: hypothetical protein QOI78_8194 [Actinomycetota bacterium]|nr:hypothetical protein [Actinomycetota bacterium]
MARTFRLAVAQSEIVEDPADVAALRASGARLVQFPEGAITYPHKRVMSVHGPERAGPAGCTSYRTPESWSGATTSGSCRTPSLRYLYTPGTEPLVVEIDGLRFGCALCIEVDFPELFAEYERLDVDCVLVSVMVDDAARATVAQAYGTLHSYWLGYSVPAQFAATVPAGIVAPGGRWIARAPSRAEPALAIADLEVSDGEVATAVRLARPWRRTARAGLYDDHVVVGDPRSEDHGSF